MAEKGNGPVQYFVGSKGTADPSKLYPTGGIPITGRFRSAFGEWGGKWALIRGHCPTLPDTSLITTATHNGNGTTVPDREPRRGETTMPKNYDRKFLGGHRAIPCPMAHGRLALGVGTRSRWCIVLIVLIVAGQLGLASLFRTRCCVLGRSDIGLLGPVLFL